MPERRVMSPRSTWRVRWTAMPALRPEVARDDGDVDQRPAQPRGAPRAEPPRDSLGRSWDRRPARRPARTRAAAPPCGRPGRRRGTPRGGGRSEATVECHSGSRPASSSSSCVMMPTSAAQRSDHGAIALGRGNITTHVADFAGCVVRCTLRVRSARHTSGISRRVSCCDRFHALLRPTDQQFAPLQRSSGARPEDEEVGSPAWRDC